jgi:hypothetical protein
MGQVMQHRDAGWAKPEFGTRKGMGVERGEGGEKEGVMLRMKGKGKKESGGGKEEEKKKEGDGSGNKKQSNSLLSYLLVSLFFL